MLVSKLPNIRKTLLEINLSRLKSNFYFAHRQVAPAEILAIVKSNAYGHGILEISSYLDKLAKKNALHGFGVATIEEGILLRKNGIEKPIYIMSGIFNMDEISFHCIESYRLTPFITSLNTLKSFARFLQKTNKSLTLHLKFNTGMNRLGINMDEVKTTIECIKKEKKLQLHGIASHLSSAEKINSTASRTQIKIFKAIINMFHSSGLYPKYIHLSNSAAALNQDFLFPEENLLRLGLGLYGEESSKKAQSKLSPIVRWVAEIYEIRAVKKGDSIGYSPAFRAKKNMKIAVLAVGYGDGYTRALSNKAEVLIQGKRCPIVGNISMDLTTVDVSKLKTVNRSSKATLLGKSGKERITAVELAKKAKSVPYNILTGISNRVHRVFINE